MKYMLIHCLHESAELDPAQAAEAQTALARWIADMAGRGVSQCGARLRPVSDAPTVRVRSGDVPVADGPFADDLGGRARRDTQPVETKEQTGGYDVIECADLDEATGVAARHPTARIGTIEVRPLLDQ